MLLNHLTIKELQRLGRSGDASALAELGKRVLDMKFCFDDDKYCSHRIELYDLQHALESEVPPECPNCGKWISDI